MAGRRSVDRRARPPADALTVREQPTGWSTAAALALTAAAALGLARFGYALVLPDMREALGWSYAQSGALNTANAVGYLAGAIASPLAARRERRAFRTALLVIPIGLACSAATGALPALLALRVIVGAAGAVAFVLGAARVAQLARPRPDAAPLLLGLYTGGAGVGIALSAVTVTPALAGGADWRVGWLILAALAAGCCAIALNAGGVPGAADAPSTASTGLRALVPALLAYALFGAGYIAYMTFVVALLGDQGASAGATAAFWCLLGASAAASALAWRSRLGRTRAGHELTPVLAVAAVGAALPALADAGGSLAASAILFGGSFMAVVTAIALLIQRVVEPARRTAALAGATVAFAVGQCAGPIASGLTSDGAGLRAGLAVSAGLLVMAWTISMAQGARLQEVGAPIDAPEHREVLHHDRARTGNDGNPRASR